MNLWYGIMAEKRKDVQMICKSLLRRGDGCGKYCGKSQDMLNFGFGIKFFYFYFELVQVIVSRVFKVQLVIEYVLVIDEYYKIVRLKDRLEILGVFFVVN